MKALFGILLLLLVSESRSADAVFRYVDSAGKARKVYLLRYATSEVGYKMLPENRVFHYYGENLREDST